MDTGPTRHATPDLHPFMLQPMTRLVVAFVCLFAANWAQAFPPAPHHVLYGLVRDQYGTPVVAPSAELYLETPEGLRLLCRLSSSLQPGTNYRMEVPMDSGMTPDPYRPNVLRASMQFRLKLRIGRTTYVPNEMVGDLAQLGKPGEETRLDLTMGEDSDGDGLPDAWEQILISRYGGTLRDIRGEDDADGDGIRNRDEFLAGTYAFDPESGLWLTLVESRPGTAVMEFLALRGRSYTLEASSDFQQWSPVSFRIVTAGVPGELRDRFDGGDMRTLRIEVPMSDDTDLRYFKTLVR